MTVAVPRLRPYQERVETAVFNGWDAGYDRLLVSGATGMGKGHPLDTEIPTPAGQRKFGDLAPGDQVFGSDGAPTTVTGVFDRGELPTYRVTFSDHTSVLVDGDHLWVVKRRGDRSPWQTQSTAELLATDRRDGKSWRWRIPMADPVRRPHAELPIPPYTLGAYIANGHGHRATSPVLTTPDLGVVEAIRAEGVHLSDQKRDPRYCPQYLLVGMQKMVAALGLDVLSADKFIPRQYLEASVEQRLALLRALMDADGGSRTGGRRSVNYHTTSPRLAADVQELVWSLGGTASLGSRTRLNRDKPGTYQDIKVMILTPAWLYPFETVRKYQEQKPRRTFVPTRAIVSIEPIGAREIRCIAVAAPDRLYQVGREHIVTHNSVVFGAVGRRHLSLRRGEGPVVLLAHRIELVEQAAEHFSRANPDLNVMTVVGSPGREGSAAHTTAKYLWKRADVLVSTPQTLNSAKTMRIFPDPSLVIVDECFVAGTLVGDVPIQDVRVGDLVPSWDEVTGIPVYRRVAATMRSVPSALVRVATSRGKFVCTPGHPFLTERGWVEAINLKSDDSVVSMQGRARVVGVQALEPGDRGVCPDGFVYNLEVEGTHTYRVGAGGLVAHNCHHYASTMFQKVLRALGVFTGTRMLGVTATPFREDYRKLDDIFERVVANVDILWLITHKDDGRGGEMECAPGEGYLVPPRLKHLLVDGLDLSEVPTSRISGAVDYREKELAEAMEAAGAFDIVAKAVVSEFSERKGVVFAPTVASSKYLTEVMNGLGAACGHLDGTMGKPERREVLNSFRTGKIRWLCNVGIVSEGFDLPEIDMVVLARPTRSRIFFRQAVGRALRPSPGKDHAIILDVAGASDGHSLAGVSALTDEDMLTPERDESLTALRDRSNRARRGVVDRIMGHSLAIKEKQNAGERSFEQLKVTAESYSKVLPGLVAFAESAAEPFDRILATCTSGIDLASTSTLPPAKTLDDLNAIEREMADKVASVQPSLAALEGLKGALRVALLAVKEDPAGDIAKAMVTGFAGTISGNLFGEEEERYEPGAPQSVTALKVRGQRKGAKEQFAGRQGWSLRTGAGHLYCPIHGGKDVRGLAVAVKLDSVYVPVVWDAATRNVEHLSVNLVPSEGEPVRMTEQDAYLAIMEFAARHTDSPNLLDPRARWRKNPASDGARGLAYRVSQIARSNGLPEDATGGYVADVITSGQHEVAVNGLSLYVAQQMGSC